MTRILLLPAPAVLTPRGALAQKCPAKSVRLALPFATGIEAE